jgi:hypothetical protein
MVIAHHKVDTGFTHVPAYDDWGDFVVTVHRPTMIVDAGLAFTFLEKV